MAEEKKPATEEKKPAGDQLNEYKSPEEAYEAGIKAVNPEDTLPALGYLRDHVKALTNATEALKKDVASRDQRIVNLSDQLSKYYLNNPIEKKDPEKDSSIEHVEEKSIDELAFELGQRTNE